MYKDIKGSFAEKVDKFSLPRYNELPTVGLYLEQVAKYINGYIVPLDFPEITTSMISNYVKKGVISAPFKKQYSSEQIAYLIFISVGKSVLSIEHISHLFGMQKNTYDAATAYDYFCKEFENMLFYISGMKDSMENIGTTETDAKTILRSVIIALSHITFANHCFGLK